MQGETPRGAVEDGEMEPVRLTRVEWLDRQFAARIKRARLQFYVPGYVLLPMTPMGKLIEPSEGEWKARALSARFRKWR